MTLWFGGQSIGLLSGDLPELLASLLLREHCQEVMPFSLANEAACQHPKFVWTHYALLASSCTFVFVANLAKTSLTTISTSSSSTE